MKKRYIDELTFNKLIELESIWYGLKNNRERIDFSIIKDLNSFLDTDSILNGKVYFKWFKDTLVEVKKSGNDSIYITFYKKETIENRRILARKDGIRYVTSIAYYPNNNRVCLSNGLLSVDMFFDDINNILDSVSDVTVAINKHRAFAEPVKDIELANLNANKNGKVRAHFITNELVDLADVRVKSVYSSINNENGLNYLFNNEVIDLIGDQDRTFEDLLKDLTVYFENNKDYKYYKKFISTLYKTLNNRLIEEENKKKLVLN